MDFHPGGSSKEQRLTTPYQSRQGSRLGERVQTSRYVSTVLEPHNKVAKAIVLENEYRPAGMQALF